MIVRYGDQEVSCVVRQTAGVKGRIRIHVYPNGDVEIEAPENKEEYQIRDAAQRRARWIFQHRNAALDARRMVLPREYVSGETHFYLGRRHKLIVRETSDELSSVKLKRGKLEITLPVADKASVKRRLNSWYRDRAEDYLCSKFLDISSQPDWIEKSPQLKFLQMKRQWGSCSPTGVIFLNPALIKAPKHCIEYVIKHELCHLIEYNHSFKFYELLTKKMPGWNLIKKELDSLSELILA